MSFYYNLGKIKQNLFLKNFNLLFENYKVIPPSFVIWEATRKCNLECIHCGSAKNIARELTTKEIKEVIIQLKAYGVHNFQITGGEPLLRDDFIEVLEFAAKGGLVTSLATNGFYIDKAKAELIARAKVSLVQISLDGNRKIHNYIRKNEQSFDKVIRAIRLLREFSNLKLAVATTVMPQNIEVLEWIKQILISFNIDSWNIGVVMPVGRASNTSEMFLSKSKFQALLAFIFRSRKEIDISLGENFPYLGKLEPKIRKNPKICPVGITSCCLGSDGNIRGCPDQPDTEYYREGNIRRESFEDIWQNGFKRYRNRQILRQDLRCSGCSDKTSCFGGCWVMRERNLHCIKDYFLEEKCLDKPVNKLQLTNS